MTTLTETGKARLLRLAEFLPTVKEEKFNISLWTNQKKAPKIDCGFVGCAMGWAATERFQWV